MLSFAVIMLNTSLHNPNVRDKPGLERFVAMNRGINEGGDLPEDLLRVSTVPSPSHLPAFHPVLQGLLVPELPHMCLFCSQFSSLVIFCLLSSLRTQHFPTITPSSFFLHSTHLCFLFYPR